MAIRAEKYHKKLAEYFEHLADPDGSLKWKGENLRPFLELPFQLHKSDTGKLKKLLWDPPWYRAKLKHTDVFTLVIDFDLVSGDDDLQLVRESIALSTNVLLIDKTELATQLVGRLMLCQEPAIKELISKIVNTQDKPWLKPLAPTLAQVGGPLLQTLVSHKQAIKIVGVTNDGKVISVSDDFIGHYMKKSVFKINIWDLATGTLLYTLEENDTLNTLKILNDGRAVSVVHSSTGLGHLFKVWDIMTGKLLYTFEIDTPFLSVIEVSDNCNVVLADDFKKYFVFDLNSGKLMRTVEGHTDWILAFATTNDGKIVSASKDHTLKVWDLNSGKLIKTLEGHTGPVCAVAITTNGKIVSGSDDGSLKIWDINTYELLHTLEGNYMSINKIEVIDESKAVTALNDNTLKVWDLNSGKFHCTLEGHSDSILDFVLTHDGKAVSSSKDHTLNVWDLNSGKLQCTLEGHNDAVNAIAISSDGKVISGSDDTTLKIWKLNSNTSRDKKIRERGPIRTVFVAKDGKVVSASSNNYIDTRENFIPSVNIVNIWDCKSSALLYTLRKNDLSVDKITVTCDNKAIFALTDNTIRVWDLNSRKLLHTLKGHTKFITDFAVTDKGKAVSASGDHTLKVWDLNSGKLEHTLEGHSDEVCAVVISNDDQIVSWSKDSTLKVWELNTGRLLRTLEGYSHSYYQKIFLAVSKNGKVVFAQSLHNIPHVWDLATGKFLYELKGYKNKINTINDLVVTADGRAVSVSNMSIIVSDIDSGELLHSINEERKCSAKKFIFSGSGNPEDGNVTEFEVEMNSNEYVHSLVLTEDGNAVSWYWNPTKKELEALKVWDLKSGKFLCSFIGEFCVSACSITDEGTIVAGDSGGYVHFLKLVFPRKYDQT